MTEGEHDPGAMRTFLTGIGHLAARPREVDTSSIAGFLASVRRLAPGPTCSRAVTIATPLSDPEAMGAFLARVDTLGSSGSPYHATPDIWGISGLRRDEQRNAAVLSWILDPRGSHGLGSAVLDALAAILRARWSHATDSLFPFPRSIDDCRVRLEMNPLGDLSRRVDIALDGRDFIAFIEVKIDAPEGREQLATYLSLAERIAATSGRTRWGVVFLGPTVPANLSADGPRVLHATWADVADAVRRVLPERGSDLARSMIQQFATHVANL